MTTCPGCSRPIEPLAAIRTYHAGCDPYARIERLEKALAQAIDLAWTGHGTPDELQKLADALKKPEAE